MITCKNHNHMWQAQLETTINIGISWPKSLFAFLLSLTSLRCVCWHCHGCIQLVNIQRSSLKVGHVIVIDLLVRDTMHTQYEARGHKAPEGKCCVCVVSRTKRSMTLIPPVVWLYKRSFGRLASGQTAQYELHCSQVILPVHRRLHWVFLPRPTSLF